MKIQSIVAFAAVLGLAGALAQAAHVWEDSSAWWDSHFTAQENAPLFTAQELSLDLFGSYLAGERGIEHLFKTDIRHGYWGGGVGLNYFLTREIGFGVDTSFSNHPGRAWDHVLGHLILRLPIESAHLAPYIFGGGGRGISPDWEWVYDAGVGLDLRFNPTTALFTDARYIWADKTVDRLQIRAGLRLIF
jgi:hypothetical protein